MRVIRASAKNLNATLCATRLLSKLSLATRAWAALTHRNLSESRQSGIAGMVSLY